MDKTRSQIQLDLARKDKELEAAVQKRDFRKITELRSGIVEIRRKVLNLITQSAKCKDACKPDVIKQTECHKLMEEIAGLESKEQAEDSEREKIDELYRKLLDCNEELKKIKEAVTP